MVVQGMSLWRLYDIRSRGDYSRRLFTWIWYNYCWGKTKYYLLNKWIRRLWSRHGATRSHPLPTCTWVTTYTVITYPRYAVISSFAIGVLVWNNKRLFGPRALELQVPLKFGWLGAIINPPRILIEYPGLKYAVCSRYQSIMYFSPPPYELGHGSIQVLPSQAVITDDNYYQLPCLQPWADQVPGNSKLGLISLVIFITPSIWGITTWKPIGSCSRCQWPVSICASPRLIARSMI